MAKRYLCLFLAVLLIVLLPLSGCRALHQFALESYDKELPLLPDRQDLIPLDVIMGYIEYTPPQISDDGEMILYRHMTRLGDDFVAENWQTGEEFLVPWPTEAAGNPYFLWAPDDETVLFFVDSMGDENYGLYISNIDTGETKTILAGGDNDCAYIADNPENEKEIYLAVFNFATEVHDIYLLNYQTGNKTLVFENPGNMAGFIFDHDGILRIITTTDEKAGNHVWLKENIYSNSTEFIQSEWKEIFSWEYEDVDTSGVLGFMQDDTRIVYFDSSLSDTSTLLTYDISTEKSQKIFNDPDYEVSGMWTDLKIDEIVAVTTYSQNLEWEILDETFEDDYEIIRSAGQGDFDIYDSSENDEYWLVAFLSDIKESDYYIYDMDSGEMTFLFNARPELEEYDLAHMEPIAFESQDGLTIEGYATFPQGEKKADLPTVVLVHGGPWARDIWQYNSEVQFLANRGYLVLQINFRGSTGYGKEFMLAADKEWGGLMHQDILDAVDYSVGMGWTDENRVGVYGASYGGYEALICAAFSSDVFSCAVDAFGPSSLLTFVDSIPAQWSIAYQNLIRSVGDPKTEAEFMKARSPLFFAEDMQIPMLIAQGENDVRVVQRESDQMVEALEEAGVPVTYLLFPNTGHGFNSSASRQEFYSKMEEFFAEYLGGESE